MSFILLNTVLLSGCAIITAATPIMLALMNYNQSKAARAAAEKVENVRNHLKNQSIAMNERLETIHVAINSERIAMINRLEAMHDEIVKLTAANIELKHDK